MLFAIGSIIQHYSHRKLANAKPLVGKYGVPDSILFRAVACPHYTSEIMIYVAFFCETARISSFLVLAFVIVNLSDSAFRTLKWYTRTFAGHKSVVTPRYALIPGVF